MILKVCLSVKQRRLVFQEVENIWHKYRHRCKCKCKYIKMGSFERPCSLWGSAGSSIWLDLMYAKKSRREIVLRDMQRPKLKSPFQMG